MRRGPDGPRRAADRSRSHGFPAWSTAVSAAYSAAPVGGRALRAGLELVTALWDALEAPGDTHEVRIPKTRRGPARLFGTTAGYFTDPAAAVRAVLSITGLDAPAVYVTLNPVNPELRARAD